MPLLRAGASIPYAIAVTLLCGCAHKAAPSPNGTPGAESDREEVVRLCIDRQMPAAMAASARELGPDCSASSRDVAERLFKAGVRIGVARGTTAIHGAGLREAAAEFQAAADVSAKIADRTRADEEKATKSAEEETAKAVGQVPAGSCVAPAAARALVEAGSHCGSTAFETDAYQAEYARAFGAVCEHQLSLQECVQRAEAAYGRTPRGAAGDAGAP
jgi:hypothetical protein